MYAMTMSAKQAVNRDGVAVNVTVQSVKLSNTTELQGVVCRFKSEQHFKIISNPPGTAGCRANATPRPTLAAWATGWGQAVRVRISGGII